MSTAYHPQSDGASECSNKTINQCLQYHVERNQTGWHRALPWIHFDIMNSINPSTGFSPFQLCMGQSPRIILPLILSSDGTIEDIRVVDVIEQLKLDIKEAQDNLLGANISQSISANEHQSNDFPFEKGNRVVLFTLHRCRDYKAKDEHQVVKFMPCYDGPYLITEMAPDISTITVNMPNHPNTFPTFHTSQALPFIENDKELFPNRELQQPPAIIVDSHEEYTINRILEEQKCR